MVKLEFLLFCIASKKPWLLPGNSCYNLWMYDSRRGEPKPITLSVYLRARSTATQNDED